MRKKNQLKKQAIPTEKQSSNAPANPITQLKGKVKCITTNTWIINQLKLKNTSEQSDKKTNTKIITKQQTAGKVERSG